ncbi:hypothetical protein EZV62_012237 [Acer yangbiense]|uniref:Neurobeachin beta-propeller domain-containing protein n=1 Tax=Acer yangbiense TaxID=1000413 RepID=A0A5C7HVP4_9ROSI|nr:hypothetical protein EZV62_012237 [Acer yangbiense]
MDLVIASSSIAEAGVGCWDLDSGTEQLRYKSCASTPHGLTCVGQRFVASSQLCQSSTTSGSVLYWSWSKPQAAVKSFPSELIKPFVSNSVDTYIVGGGQSGDIYLWEVETGRLIKKWHAHYRAVTCLVFSSDDSLLISGSEDGCVRVWSLIIKAVTCLAYSIEGNLLLSRSEDGIVRIWDPRTFNIVRMFKHGKGPVNNILVIRQPNHLTLGAFSNSHVSSRRQGSPLPPPPEKYVNMDKDTYKMGVICLPTACNIPPDVPFNSTHILDEHVKLVEVFYFSPNVLDTLCYPRFDFCLCCSHIVMYYAWPLSSIPNILLLIFLLKMNCIIFHRPEISIHLYFVVFSLQQQGSSAANEMEVERLKLENRKAMHMVQQWKKMYGNLHEFCVTELLKGDGVGSTD